MVGDSASELIDQFGTETFKAVHESDQDGLIYFEGDGSIAYANRAALELFGLDSNVIGENIFELRRGSYETLPVELIFPSDHFDKARKTFEKGVPTRSELIVVDGDERREIEAVWGPVEQDGEITGIVGSYRDVSPRPDIHDQLSSEAARLDEQRRILASVIEMLDDGVLVFDDDAALQFANTAARDLLRLESPVEGTELETLLDRANLEAPRRFARQFRRTASQKTSSGEIQLVEGDGETVRRIDVQMTPAGVERDRLVCTLSERAERTNRQRMRLLSMLAANDPDSLDRKTLAERIVDALVEELDVDLAVLMEFEDGFLAPLAGRGVMLDPKLRLELADHPDLEATLDRGRPERIGEIPLTGGNQNHEFDQVVIPLGTSKRAVGTLHIGRASEFDAATFRPQLNVGDRAFVETMAEYIADALVRSRTPEFDIANSDRFQAILEAVPDGVMVYNHQGDVLAYNRAAVEITEFDGWENLNRDSRPFRVLDPDGEPLPRSERPFFRAVHERAACGETILLDFGHTSRDVFLHAAPVEEKERRDETLFVGTMHDVTEQRRLNRRKDEFLSIASHELRNPLTPLTGVLQLARRQRERQEQVDLSLLTRAERQVSRLTRLIDGLLDLTRIEMDRVDLELREVDFGAFIENRIDPWRLHPKDIELDVSTPDKPIHVEVDTDRINQVVTNLVDNAIKYSNADGRIRVEVSEAGAEIVVGVEDDGVGMDEETVDQIFDRFYHGDGGPEISRSTGLGLYICRQIVEEHDGTISVESEKDEGTRVEIRLPKYQSEET